MGLNSAVMFCLVWFDSCSGLESAFRLRMNSCSRHSARSAFRPPRVAVQHFWLRECVLYRFVELDMDVGEIDVSATGW